MFKQGISCPTTDTNRLFLRFSRFSFLGCFLKELHLLLHFFLTKDCFTFAIRGYAVWDTNVCYLIAQSSQSLCDCFVSVVWYSFSFHDSIVKNVEPRCSGVT